MNVIDIFRTKRLIDVPVPHGNDLVRFMGKMPVTGYSGDFSAEQNNGPESFERGRQLLENSIRNSDSSKSASVSKTTPTSSESEAKDAPSA